MKGEMIQTMTTGRSDLFTSSPHHPPIPHRDSILTHPLTSSSSSSERSHYAIPGDSSYSQNIQRLLESDVMVRDFGSVQRPRQKDHFEDQNGHKTSKPIRMIEHVNIAAKEHDALNETLPAGRTVSNSLGFQRQQARTPQQRPEGMWARAGSDQGVTRHYDDVDDDDVDFISPPKIAPVSGRIPVAVDHPLVRPIPYKPIVVPSAGCYDTPRHKDTSQNSSLDRQPSIGLTNPPSQNTDEGYASRDWQNLSSSSSVSQNSSHDLSSNGNRKPVKTTPCGNDSISTRKRFDSDPAAAAERGTGRNYERCSERTSGSLSWRRRGFSSSQTPSPSDSSVWPLEAMLREKDVELQMLRETMERNELAMMQVFEEKQQKWEMEMGDVVQEWQLKLRSHQQKAFRTEQSLLLQIFKLQQDNNNLRQSLDRVNAEKESNGQPYSGVEDDLKTARARLEELLWELRQATGEIDVLRTQLRNAVEESSTKSMELISAQLLLKDGEIEIDCKNAEIHRLLTDLNQIRRELSATNEQRLNLACRLKKFESNVECSSMQDGLTASEALRVELDIVQKELEGLRATLERERNQWFEEKTKVVNYQKHLQLNYVQIARKSKMLETEVQQMSAELERHDADCQRATTEESFC